MPRPGCLQERAGAEDGRSRRQGARGLGGRGLLVRTKATISKCSRVRDVPPPAHGAPRSGDAARRLGAAAWRALSQARWPPPLTPTTEGPSAPRCRPGTLRAHDALSRPTGEDLTPKGRSQNSKYIHEIPFLLKMSIDASVAHSAGDLQRIYIFRISLM